MPRTVQWWGRAGVHHVELYLLTVDICRAGTVRITLPSVVADATH